MTKQAVSLPENGIFFLPTVFGAHFGDSPPSLSPVCAQPRKRAIANCRQKPQFTSNLPTVILPAFPLLVQYPAVLVFETSRVPAQPGSHRYIQSAMSFGPKWCSMSGTGSPRSLLLRAESELSSWKLTGREEKGMPIPDDFQQTLQQERTANKHFLAGDAAPVKATWSHAGDVTICGGFGAYEKGWEQVSPRLDWAAARYLEGDTTIEMLAMGASGDLA